VLASASARSNTWVFARATWVEVWAVGEANVAQFVGRLTALKVAKVCAADC
jgi:hypothetical protein